MRRLRPVFDDSAFTQSSAYRSFISSLRASETERAQGTGDYQTVFDLLEQPMREAPDSIEQQLSWVSKHWGRHVGSELRARLGVAIGIIHEEHRFRGDGGPPGPPPVLTFGRPDEEYERFSSDQDWMSNVVLLAKSTYVWLDQLSRKYERDISRIDLIPDENLIMVGLYWPLAYWALGAVTSICENKATHG